MRNIKCVCVSKCHAFPFRLKWQRASSWCWIVASIFLAKHGRTKHFPAEHLCLSACACLSATTFVVLCARVERVSRCVRARFFWHDVRREIYAKRVLHTGRTTRAFTQNAHAPHHTTPHHTHHTIQHTTPHHTTPPHHAYLLTPGGPFTFSLSRFHTRRHRNGPGISSMKI